MKKLEKWKQVQIDWTQQPITIETPKCVWCTQQPQEEDSFYCSDKCFKEHGEMIEIRIEQHNNKLKKY